VKNNLKSVGRPSVLRHANALHILKLLQAAGSCSRADLVRASGLSAPTVTNVVRDLQDAGLVEPLGEGESSGGRPPDMIRFKAERGCILAIEISACRLHFLLTDLNGIEIGRSIFEIAKQTTTPVAICKYIGQTVRAMLRKQKMTRDQLMAVVVGVPAITNVQQGVVLSISTLEKWRNVSLRSMLRKVVPCLVIIENDINLAAQGEQYNGAAKGETNFILISIGTNLGAGIVLNGQVHHGSQWSAGEIGYLRLPNTSRRAPTIHEFGEVETVLSSAGMLASWREAASKSSSRNPAYPKTIDALAILQLAEDGDPRAEKIVQYRATLTADIVVNLSLVLNPNLILVGGEIGSHPELVRLVVKQLLGSEFGVAKVSSGKLGTDAVLWGGISTALESIPDVLMPERKPAKY
jgi:glucokinase